ncbi:MAG: hypothetical protein NTZ33_02825 [Bacteroidetes bacterium]|nr:hypothetical protein [Bacteroidota bacterium]
MKHNKLTLLILIAGLFISLPSFSQKDTAKFGIRFNGFVNSQIMYDTRQTVGGRETMLLLYPENKKADKNGNDINATPSFNQLAMITRLTANVFGPDVFNAKATALFEGDFTGQTNNDNNGFRLRHAYVKLKWQNSELLMGQYWHPFDVPEMIPYTIALSAGAPFHAFSRHIQVRYSHNFGRLKIIGVMASQRDYSNDGPLGVSSVYLRNAVIPDLHLQLQYTVNHHLFGIGGDFKMIQPRLLTDSNIKTDARVKSFAAIGFAKLVYSKVDIKLQASCGENLSEHTMLGGYFEKAIDPKDGSITYGNLQTANLWTDIATKGSAWTFGLFAGYTKNLGYSSKIMTNGKFYGRGNTIDYIYRIAPRIFYTTGPLQFGSEFEYTAAAYGTPDTKGIVNNTAEYANFRVLLSATYNF